MINLFLVRVFLLTYFQILEGAAVNSPQRRQGNVQAVGRPEEESADEMLLPV